MATTNSAAQVADLSPNTRRRWAWWLLNNTEWPKGMEGTPEQFVRTVMNINPGWHQNPRRPWVHVLRRAVDRQMKIAKSDRDYLPIPF